MFAAKNNIFLFLFYWTAAWAAYNVLMGNWGIAVFQFAFGMYACIGGTYTEEIE